MTRLIRTVLILTALVLSANRTASAHTRILGGGGCGVCQTGGQIWHWFSGGAGGKVTDDGMTKYDCESFNSCHSNSQGGYCIEFHDLCSYASVDVELKRLLASRKPAAIRQLAAAKPQYIKIADGYVLEYDCKGETLISATRMPADGQIERLSHEGRTLVANVTAAVVRWLA
ncbi:MAG: hypothetical protein JWM95_3618 [Gemmatimonadetes bacterium]|nr:hypothetical protein [Gemmatimonadota bacterium]